MGGGNVITSTKEELKIEIYELLYTVSEYAESIMSKR